VSVRLTTPRFSLRGSEPLPSAAPGGSVLHAPEARRAEPSATYVASTTTPPSRTDLNSPVCARRKRQATPDEAFASRFQAKALPDALNERHEIRIVASELDPSTERIVTYLSGT
jgi:hypothetical protein